MIFKVIAFVVLSLFAESVSAQRGLKGMRAAKIGVLTQHLNLSEQQAQNFWPVFNAFEFKRRTLRRQYKLVLQEAKNAKSSAKIEETFALRESEISLERAYLVEFRKVLSEEQVVLLYSFDKEYAKYLIKGMSQQTGSGSLAAPDKSD